MDRHPFLSRAAVLTAAVAAAVVLSLPARAQDRPAYPRVNTAVSYQVDPAWPKRSAGMPRGPVSGVMVDREDNVYVFTRADPPVQVYDRGGNLLRTWGGGRITKAHQIRLGPDGNVWVTDIGSHLVMKFTPDGRPLLEIGTRDKPGCDATHLNQPTDVAVTPAGDVFVSDGYGNSRVAHFTQDGTFVKAWGTLGTKPGEFSLPHSIAVDSRGRLYVADRNNVRIQVFDQTGKLLDVWPDVITPWGLCVTPKDEVWVCGSTPEVWDTASRGGMLGIPPKDQVLMRFTPDGKLAQLWAVPKGEDGKERPGDLNWVHCLALDSKGDIYAGDINGQRIQKFVRRAGAGQ
jgi:DNA-binding beta-propeller fold protein YncE